MTLVTGYFAKLIRLYFIYIGLALGGAAAVFCFVETWRFLNNPIVSIGICLLEIATATLFLRMASQAIGSMAARFRDTSKQSSRRAGIFMAGPEVSLRKALKFGGTYKRDFVVLVVGALSGWRLSYVVALAVVVLAIVGALGARHEDGYSQTAQGVKVLKAGKPVIITSGETSAVR